MEQSNEARTLDPQSARESAQAWLPNDDAPRNAKCKATRKNGEPCTAVTVLESGYCFFHDPDMEEERKEARKKGGLAKSNQSRILAQLPPRLSADQLDRYLGLILRGVVLGKVSPKVATATAHVARAMVSVRSTCQNEEDIIDVIEVTDRMEARIFQSIAEGEFAERQAA